MLLFPICFCYCFLLIPVFIPYLLDIEACCTMPCRQVRMLRKRLKVITELEKNITEQQIDATKHLTLAPSTLFMVSKERENEEQI